MRGLQIPPIEYVPEYVKTYGPKAVEFLQAVGVNLDPWQERIFHKTLAIRDNQKWAATDVGLVVSRQAGKTMYAVARILIGLFVLKEKTIIYSAHRADTSHEILNRLVDIINSSSELQRRTKHIYTANGKEQVITVDGCRVLFRTRVNGGGRGFSCDCLIMDEAMILTREFLGDVGPTLSAMPNPQLIMMGSAGDENSEAFGDMRNRALGDDPGLLYWAEWSARVCTEDCSDTCTKHDDPYSEETYAKTNPAYGIRISHEAIEADRRRLSREEFLIERLSVGNWPKKDSEFAVIDALAWERQFNDQLEPVGRPVFAVTTSHDRLETALAVAVWTDGAKTRMLVMLTQDEGVDLRPGTKWLPERAKELDTRWKPYAWAIDVKGQAGTFIETLEDDYDLKVISPKAIEYAQSCARVKVGITGTDQEEPFIFHPGQPELTKSVADADTRPLSGLWAWARSSDSASIIALEAATLAVWGLLQETERERDSLWIM